MSDTWKAFGARSREEQTESYRLHYRAWWLAHSPDVARTSEAMDHYRQILGLMRAHSSMPSAEFDRIEEQERARLQRIELFVDGLIGADRLFRTNEGEEPIFG